MNNLVCSTQIPTFHTYRQTGAGRTEGKSPAPRSPAQERVDGNQNYDAGERHDHADNRVVHIPLRGLDHIHISRRRKILYARNHKRDNCQKSEEVEHPLHEVDQDTRN